jgi:hypothetical protein
VICTGWHLLWHSFAVAGIRVQRQETDRRFSGPNESQFWQNGQYESFRSVMYAISIPPWLPVVFFCVAPGVAFARGPLRRRLFRRRGLCEVCAYDLTGNISGVCPECGEPTSATRHV